MSKQLSHEDIAQKFMDFKVVDFNAVGNLIKELGPVLAVHDGGLHGVQFGRFNVLACMLSASDLTRVVGNLNQAAVTSSVIAGATAAAEAAR